MAAWLRLGLFRLGAALTGIFWLLAAYGMAQSFPDRSTGGSVVSLSPGLAEARLTAPLRPLFDSRLASSPDLVGAGSAAGAAIVINRPAAEPLPPDLTANPGRPALTTSALLTPLGYAQFENGVLFAADSGEFSQRVGLEETMRLTVAPRLQWILSVEPIAYSSFAQGRQAAGGDTDGGLQVVVLPGHGVKPTVSVSYLRRLRAGAATDLDIGSSINSAVLLASADLGRFHVDANGFLNEQSAGPARRGQFGQSVAVSHPLTAKLGMTGELRHYTRPFNTGAAYGTLWSLAYSVRPNLVVDAGAVAGLTGGSTRWQTTGGVTYVLPHRVWGGR